MSCVISHSSINLQYQNNESSFFVKSIILFISVLYLCVPISSFANTGADNGIQIISPEQPAWRLEWQKGRELTDIGALDAAVPVYEKILLSRPYLTQVRWELVKLLFDRKEYLNAKNNLILLLDLKSDDEEYNLLAGDINYQLLEYQNALLYYNSVYETSAFTELGTRALIGLVNSNLGLGNDAAALPLLRQLVAIKPEKDLFTKLLDLSIKFEIFPESENIIELLMSNGELSIDKALSLVKIFANNNKIYASLLEYSLTIKPDAGDLRYKLIDLYLETGDFNLAENHLAKLPFDQKKDLLYKAASIYKTTANRPDKALVTYEEILSNIPNDNNVLGNITKLRIRLAETFLILAENISPDELWVELSGLTKFPEQIILSMIHLLNEKKDFDTSLVLLDFTAPIVPVNDYLLIARHYHLLKKNKVSYKYITQVDSKSKSSEFYKLKFKLEKDLGFEYKSLLSQIQYVKKSGLTHSKLSQLVNSAKALGCLSLLDSILDGALDKELLGSELAGVIALEYSREGLGHRALRYLSVLADDEVSTNINLIKYHIYNNLGKKYQAHKYLRQMILDKKKVQFSASHIGLQELTKGRIESARLLYDYARQNSVEDTTVSSRYTFVELGVKLFWLESEYTSAEQLLDRFLGEKKLSRADELKSKLLLAETFQKANEKKKYSIARAKADKTIEKLANNSKGRLSLSEQLSRADILYQAGQHHEAIDSFMELSKDLPRSKLVKRRLVDLNFELGNYDKSLDILNTLLKDYPEEDYYRYHKALALGRLGKKQEKISLLQDYGKFNNSNKVNKNELAVLDDIYRDFNLARAMWVVGDRADSLALYERIIHQLKPMLQGLEELPSVDTTYWSGVTEIFYFEYDDTDQKMSLSYLLENLDNEKANILAELYPVYKWYSLVSKEFEARNATYQQRLMLAERKYRQLFQEDKNSEAIADLAPIYKRLRNFEEEAKVYKFIQDNGRYASELSKSIDENTKQRAASLQNTILFSDREGRNEAIDMQKYQYSLSYEFDPQENNNLYLEYVLNRYSGSSDHSVGQYLGGGISIDFNSDTNLSALLGGEYLDSNDSFNLHGLARLDHRLFDRLKTYLEYSHERVDDTIEAIEEDIFVDNFGVGAVFESPIGIDFGIEYNYGYLTDNNEQSLLRTWLLYNIFFDNIRIDLRYDGTYFSGEGENVLPYWNPIDYREHKFSAYYQQQIAGFGTSNQENSYYAFELGAGFEDDQNIIYSGKFDILLEMNDQFLLKGSLLYSASDEYDESSVQFDVVYRW